MFRLVRFQTDTLVEVVQECPVTGFPAAHPFHDFLSLLSTDGWFFSCCHKNTLIKLLQWSWSAPRPIVASEIRRFNAVSQAFGFDSAILCGFA